MGVLETSISHQRRLSDKLEGLRPTQHGCIEIAYLSLRLAVGRYTVWSKSSPTNGNHTWGRVRRIIRGGEPMSGNAPLRPCEYFSWTLNARLAMSHSSGQRARSGMRFSFVSFHSFRGSLCSSMLPCWPQICCQRNRYGFKPDDLPAFF